MRHIVHSSRCIVYGIRLTPARVKLVYRGSAVNSGGDRAHGISDDQDTVRREFTDKRRGFAFEISGGRVGRLITKVDVRGPDVKIAKEYVGKTFIRILTSVDEYMFRVLIDNLNDKAQLDHLGTF